ncbi:MAG: hypothetical protein WCO13_03860 [Bacteroidota bacterium]
MRPLTLNLPLTYNQIISLVEQLPINEKIKLGKKIAEEALDEKLTRLLNSFKTDELQDEIITEEVENVRKELYAKNKKH